MADQTATDLPTIPEGTVTFLSSDIEGSTRLLRTLGEGYGPLLDEIRRLIRGAVETEDGVVIDQEGDASFASFAVAGAALRSAAAIQQGLATGRWPESLQIRARIGVHSGTAWIRQGRYVGLDVHRTGRITAAGHGGQVVVSASARSLGQDAAAQAGLQWLDLGEHRLKDLPESIRLFQLLVPGLPSEFPALRAPSIGGVAAPTTLTPLVGRETEVGLAVDLLRRPGVRLVTLTGPGGIGKTRLALAVAAALAGDFPSGFVFVSLAEVSDPDGVLPQIAIACGLPVDGSIPPEEVLGAGLAGDRRLLVLDNFEQVAGAAAAVASVVARLPELRAIVTSRVVLLVAGEHEFPVPPLRLPDGSTPAAVGASEAVRLFEQRAAEVRPGFVIDADSAPVVASIVRRLDGIPLAIELAASRLRVLSPTALLARLGDRLDLVAGNRTDLPDRQRTLRATLDWSHDLLLERDRVLFARLAVARGSWNLEIATALADDATGDALEGVARLIDHSLVTGVDAPADPEPRFRMLEPIRQYAVERLRERGDWDLAHERLVAHLAGMGERVARDLFGPEGVELIEQIDLDWGNLVAAGRWALERGRFAPIVSSAWNLWIIAYQRYHIETVRRTMDQVLEEADLDPLSLARTKFVLAGCHYLQGDHAVAEALAVESLEGFRALGDVEGTGLAVFLLGTILPYRASGDDAASAAVAAQALANELEALEIARRLEHHWLETAALGTIGVLAALRGDLDEAQQRLGDAVQVARTYHYPAMEATYSAQLGVMEVLRGRTGEARRMLLEASAGATVNRESFAYCLEALAAIEVADGRPRHAAVALGAAGRLRALIGIEPWPAVGRIGDELTASVRTTLGETVYAAARGEGNDLDEAAMWRLLLEQGPAASAAGTADKMAVEA